jgi:DNA polymerase elongation subunit (family B)
LFDIYPNATGVIVWILNEDGHPHQLRYPYHPAFFISGDHSAQAAAERALQHGPTQTTLIPTSQRELMSGDEIPVVRVTVHNPLALPTTVRLLTKIPGLSLYNCDIAVAHLFLYETGLFPLARCAVEHVDGNVRSMIATTRPEELEYTIPSLVTLRMRLERSSADPLGASPTHGRRGLLEVGVEGDTAVLGGDDPVEVVNSLNRFLKRYDPDVILTEWGDAFLLPQIRALAARAKIPLALNRDPHAGIRMRRSRSYVTYGQVVYQAGAQMLHGRWHIDLRNSFIFGESEMAGLLEIARLARLPVQYLARTSTGTAISSMQLARAIRDGILIPWQKSEPEGFKTASQLIVTDKGGLTYQPTIGLFEGVGELDFSSMYPTMMAFFNISPETIGCTCCPDSHVPEINYTICTKRRGLVPRVLDHLLERRTYYKQRKRETIGDARAIYDQRQTALKWCLVTCLDGNTIVLYQREGRWKLAPIRDIVEAYLPGQQWGQKPVEDLAVVGIDQNLCNSVKRVRYVSKVPAPPKMIRMKLRWGRELLMTANHRCYVLQDGQLQIKRADQLKPGEWVPLAVSLDEITEAKIPEIDLIRGLQGVLPKAEQKRWRVFGRAVQQTVRKRYPALVAQARREYTAKTIWNWREYGYLPLSYVQADDFTPLDRTRISLGRGKLSGGIIQRMSSQIAVDEDLGFLLGFFVGDGSRTNNGIRFAVGANEQEHLVRLRAILRRKFRLKVHRYRERKAKMYILQVNSIGLLQVFKDVFGVEGSADRGKLRVPEIILNGPQAAKRGFILGLIASDGSVSRKRNFASIASASRRFINEVGLLLTLLGVDYRVGWGKRLHQIQTKNLAETEKIFRDGTTMISRKHLRILRYRQSITRSFRLSQIPVEASGMLRLSKVARVARAPRVSGIEMVSKALAQVKLHQLLGKRLRLERFASRLAQYQRLVSSSLAFSPVIAIEEVAYDSPFVYCFELADEPTAFFTEGGILTANSFGYLGYRNARFGRIEAHEAVTAYSREMLLRAKEVAEARGFQMLHALVDSMWLHKPGATRQDYEALAQEVTSVTALPIFVEGVYRWIGFLPSKTHPGVGVPNRYLGVFEDNTTKVRGIEVRRSDVPILIEQMQERMLMRMFGCATVAELQAAVPALLRILEEALVRLQAGEVTAHELVVTNTLSQEPHEYVHNTVQAITARTLERSGVTVHPGEPVQYIITDRKAKIPDERVRPYALLGTDWSYDPEAYAEMLLRAAETVLELFGYSMDRLRREVWTCVRANLTLAKSRERSVRTGLGSGY